MKKTLSVMLSVLLIAAIMFTLSACSSNEPCSVILGGFETIEIVSAPEGVNDLVADGNKVTFKISKKGTYDINVLTDGEENTITVTRDKDGYTVSTSAYCDVIVSVG